MRLLSFCFNLLISFNMAAGPIFTAIPSDSRAINQTDVPVRVDGFGLEMSALPALTVDNVASIMQQVAATGAGYIRQKIDWSLIETSPGVYDWSSVVPLDLLFATADAQGIRVVAVLTGGPVYLAAEGEPISISAVKDRWVVFVQAAVARFGEYVDIWEIGSAINSNHALSSFVAPLSPGQAYEPNAVDYSILLRAASDVIKDTDANDQVWLGSLTGLSDGDCAMNPLTYLLELNAAKSWRYFDAIPYTPSQGSAAPEYPSSGTINSACASNLMTTPASIAEEIRAVQELARQLGGKQVLITSMGWSADELAALSANRDIPATQVEADMLVRASVSLMSQNTIPVIIWNADILANESARHALSNMQKLLHNTKPLGRIEGQDAAVHIYHFRKSGEYTIIAWRVVEGDSAAQVSLYVGEIPALSAWASDSVEIARRTALMIRSDEGKALVLLNERPVILNGRSGDLILNVRYSIEDQVELAQLELRDLMKSLLNEAKREFVRLLEKELDEAKESALEWGENKLDELLP